MKKVYKKPTMSVVELHHNANLLVGSGYPGDLGYIPSDATDMNSMA